MSKITKNICDFCGREIKSEDFFKIKVKSSSFVNYVNHDALRPDRRSFDICRECIKEFKAWQIFKDEYHIK